MKRLVITATPLIDRWSVTSTVRRDRSAWPPSPDTLFSALVAAAASQGIARHPSLYWLEALGNPTIEASTNPPRSDAIEAFSPVADRSMWEKGARQARWHNSIGDPGLVSWSWATDETEHVEDLQRIVRDVTYIGSSRGPVLATSFLSSRPVGEDALVPDDNGRHRIRGLYRGRLDELEAAHQRGERARPTEGVGYSRLSEKRVVSTWGQLIPLRRVQGQALHLAYSVPVAEAIRLALTRHLPDGGPGMLTGHESDGSPLRAEHLAIVPLSRVGDRYADGEILGMGLLLPRSLSDSDYGNLITSLGSWLAAGGHVKIGGIRWTMEVAHNDHRLSLRETRYSAVGSEWASVTPIVFDRHPRRNLGLKDVVSSMCRDVGLPAPDEVVTTTHGALKGTVCSTEHRLGARDYLGRKLVSHLRVRWSREIEGPIVLGRGRYFGLGVMLPVKEAA